MTDIPQGSAAAFPDLPCLVLVGGLGTRLRSVLSDLPKPMAAIAGKPFLEYLVRWLRKSGIRRVILCCGYRSEEIQQYFQGGVTFGLQITYSLERDPQGTWGAIRQAGQFVTGQDFLVLNGDSWLQVDLGRLLDFHVSRGAMATIAAVEVVDASRFGSLEVDSSSGRIVAFHEKRGPGNTLVNGGVYVFSREVFAVAPPAAFSLEKEVFPILLRHGVFAMPIQGYFVDIGLPEEYKRLEDNAENWMKKLGLRKGGAKAC
jgi:D-glycero-alpha-D-manno-heptose 1-phosphate guanylyltransferase